MLIGTGETLLWEVSWIL